MPKPEHRGDGITLYIAVTCSLCGSPVRVLRRMGERDQFPSLLVAPCAICMSDARRDGHAIALANTGAIADGVVIGPDEATPRYQNQLAKAQSQTTMWERAYYECAYRLDAAHKTIVQERKEKAAHYHKEANGTDT